MPRVLAVFALEVIETVPVFVRWIVHGLHALLVLCIPHPQLGRVLETNTAVYDQPCFLETDRSSSTGLCFLLEFHHLMLAQYIYLGGLLSRTPQYPGFSPLEAHTINVFRHDFLPRADSPTWRTSWSYCLLEGRCMMTSEMNVRRGAAVQGAEVCTLLIATKTQEAVQFAP